MHEYVRKQKEAKKRLEKAERERKNDLEFEKQDRE